MTAYYNEIDPYAAQWLRNLIAAGHIAPGIVDERSIEDVTPYDLKEFTQCHFFAGIGVWSYALRRAGWADDRPIWTGSCPCQPFSSAGKGAGFADERHLWPAFNHLIRECRPTTVIGEQVASKDSEPWLDLVQADLEALGYAFGAIPFPSAGIGAPHIRDRLYWVANTQSDGHFQRKLRNKNGAQCSAYSTGQDQRRWESRFTSGGEFGGLANTASDRWRRQGAGGAAEEGWQPRPERIRQLPDGFEGHGASVRMANTEGGGWREEFAHGGRRVAGDGTGEVVVRPRSGNTGGLADTEREGLEGGERGRAAGTQGASSRHTAECDSACGLGDANEVGRQQFTVHSGSVVEGVESGRRESIQRGKASGSFASTPTTGPTNGFWGAADWLLCRDGKWRPVEPGTFPLAHGAPARVGRLRAYGNAINAEAARIFIESVM